MTTLDKALAYIAERGGVALGEPFTREGENAMRIHVRCADAHEWDPQVNNLATRHWCAICYGNVPRTIEEMRQIATARGGECLSAVYVDIKTHLDWRCAQLHEWKATPNNIANKGSWCPHCVTTSKEEVVRAALEEAFPGDKFLRTRQLDWLQGNHGRALELDGYNERLHLAFEYQGVQHDREVPHFHRTADAFVSQQERDMLTAELCCQHNVTLLVIPHTVPHLALRAHVRSELESLGYELQPVQTDDAAFYDAVVANDARNAAQYARIVAVIEAKGGVCLSPKYIGYRVPMRIRCGHGHDFEATPEAIDQPPDRGVRFCPTCGGTARQSDEALKERVEACPGYQLISSESRRSEGDGRMRRYVTIRCPSGHENTMLWDNFSPTDGVPKRGCPTCGATRKGGRVDLRQFLERTGLRNLDPYTAVGTKIRWSCPQNHEFLASYTVLKTMAEPCTACYVSTRPGVELLTPWVATNANSTPLSWRCTVCHKIHVLSLNQVRKRHQICPH